MHYFPIAVFLIVVIVAIDVVVGAVFFTIALFRYYIILRYNIILSSGLRIVVSVEEETLKFGIKCL